MTGEGDMPDRLSETPDRYLSICRHGALRRSCEPCDLADDLAEAQAEVASLRALLREYGRHTLACDDAINRSEFPESEPCVCGRDRSKP